MVRAEKYPQEQSTAARDSVGPLCRPIPPDFHFEEEKHIYTLKQESLISVTQIIDDNGFIDKRHFSKKACSRGKAVHKAIQLHLCGRLDAGTLHPDLRGYFDSALRLLEHEKPRIWRTEWPAFHPIYKYAGCIDLLGVWRGVLYIWDWKTGPYAFWHKRQSGGYGEIVKEWYGKRPRRASIHLKADGSMPHIEIHYDDSDGQYFLAYLSVTRDRQAAGIKNGDEENDNAEIWD